MSQNKAIQRPSSQRHLHQVLSEHGLDAPANFELTNASEEQLEVEIVEMLTSTHSFTIMNAAVMQIRCLAHLTAFSKAVLRFCKATNSAGLPPYATKILASVFTKGTCARESMIALQN